MKKIMNNLIDCVIIFICCFIHCDKTLIGGTFKNGRLTNHYKCNKCGREWEI